jgi:diguanylate cyclase (GGDEF)-like protein
MICLGLLVLMAAEIMRLPLSSNRALIRILLVGVAKEVCPIRELLESRDSPRFQIADVVSLELAAERLCSARVDILLLDLGSNRRQSRAFVQAARAAAPDMPMVILSESEDEALAVEALRQGVQDCLAKEKLDRENLVRSLRYSIERHRLQKNLQNLSLTDDLTGLHNRRGFLALAEQHLRTIRRKGAAMLVYVDLDDLKVINDNYGHLQGNRALIVTANVLRACFRQSDIIARVGGDEFCVLMTDAHRDSAQQLHKRLQQRVDFIDTPSPSRFQLSLSVGMAEVSHIRQRSLEELLKIADSRMYEDKRKKGQRSSVSPALKQPAAALSR